MPQFDQRLRDHVLCPARGIGPCAVDEKSLERREQVGDELPSAEFGHQGGGPGYEITVPVLQRLAQKCETLRRGGCGPQRFQRFEFLVVRGLFDGEQFIRFRKAPPEPGRAAAREAIARSAAESCGCSAPRR